MDSDLSHKFVDGFFPKASRLLKKGEKSAPVARFWVIWGKAGPRWIVPRNPAHGLPALRSWRPFDAASQVKWALLMGAYRIGALGCIPGIGEIAVAPSEDADWSHLGWQTRPGPKLVVHVGTPSAAQRFVASLVDSATREVKAVVKAPIGARSAERILHEADILERLAEEKPGLGPRLLFRNAERGIATEEPLHGRPTGRRLTAAHVTFLDRLRISQSQTSLRDEVEKLRPALALLPPEQAQRIGRLLDGLDLPAPLPAVWLHGDFAPWNLFLQNGALVACDWENAQARGLPLFDAMHFMWIQRYLFSDHKSDSSLETLRARFHLEADDIDRISKFYRVAMIVKGAMEDPNYVDFLLWTLDDE